MAARVNAKGKVLLMDSQTSLSRAAFPGAASGGLPSISGMLADLHPAERDELIGAVLAEAGSDPLARAHLLAALPEDLTKAGTIEHLLVGGLRAMNAANWQEASAALRFALDRIAEPATADNQLLAARIRHKLAEAEIRLAHFSAAREALEQANAMLERLCAPTHDPVIYADLAFGVHLLGDVEYALANAAPGDPVRRSLAASAYRYAQELCDSAQLGPDHPLRVYCAQGLDRTAGVTR